MAVGKNKALVPESANPARLSRPGDAVVADLRSVGIAEKNPSAHESLGLGQSKFVTISVTVLDRVIRPCGES